MESTNAYILYMAKMRKINYNTKKFEGDTMETVN